MLHGKLGMDRLRVINASMTPTLIRGNANAPTIMIAERAAEHPGEGGGPDGGREDPASRVTR